MQPGKEAKDKDGSAAGKSAAPASDASARQIEQLQKESKDLKVSTLVVKLENL